MSKSSDLAYRKIKREIQRGRLVPGEHLKEKELAELCNVSRTPVREALRRLESEMLIKRTDTGRVHVVRWSGSEIKEMFVLRGMLEGYAAELVAKDMAVSKIEQLVECNVQIRNAIFEEPSPNIKSFVEINQGFHNIIINSTGSERLKFIIVRLVKQPIIYRTALSYDRKNMETSLQEHENLVQAIIKKDPDWAREVMSGHIRRAYHAYVDSEMSLELT